VTVDQAWLESAGLDGDARPEATWPRFVNETQVRIAGKAAMGLFCHYVEEEYAIPGHPLRVDLCGHLSNGEWALVECKVFSQWQLSPFVDAIDQAASYANAIEYPVFIGPVYGSPLEMAMGRHDNAIGALHLMAGRMNVGFLWVNEQGDSGLLLMGQNVIDTRRGAHANFEAVWRYKRRYGSGTR